MVWSIPTDETHRGHGVLVFDFDGARCSGSGLWGRTRTRLDGKTEL